MNPGQFRILKLPDEILGLPDEILELPDEILELPSVFYPSRANKFSEFLENGRNVSTKIRYTYSKKQVFKIHQNWYRFSKKKRFLEQNFSRKCFSFFTVQN
jgi:hypothetical protein